MNLISQLLEWLDSLQSENSTATVYMMDEKMWIMSMRKYGLSVDSDGKTKVLQL